jgi:vacuolar-type H+-ATPase subunit E/Vma4
VSLQAILDAICASGEAQVREIEARTQAQVKQLLAEAQVEARRLREESHAKAVGGAAAARARTMHRARFEAQQIIGNARQALVDAALSQTSESLAGVRMAPAYRAILRESTEEALAELGGSPHKSGKLWLQVDSRDREWLEAILQDMQLELPVKAELECWGGLIAHSEDGRVIVVNTLEARLERATPYLRHFLATLFGDGQSTAEDQERATQCPVTIMAMPVCER